MVPGRFLECDDLASKARVGTTGDLAGLGIVLLATYFAVLGNVRSATVLRHREEIWGVKTLPPCEEIYGVNTLRH